MKYFLIISILFLSSCMHSPKCSETRTGTATLIGYKVAKHSHLLFRLNETGTIHDIGSLGGRREPTIPLNSTISVKYCISGDRITLLIDGSDYAKYPENSSSREVNYDY